MAGSEMNTDMHVEPVKEETRRKAVRVVAENAQGPEDFAMLAAILGLTGDIATCSECKGPISLITNLGRTRLARNGVCVRCVEAESYAARKKGDE